jgi:dTDP-4-amino-4,6-dideoxygalactose transaminase
MVPFFELKRQYASIKPEIQAAINKVLDDGNFILGKEVEAFEKEFAAYIGAKHCVALNSGTDALTLSLRCAGIKQHDEVILPSHTFISTALAVSNCGATPVLAECDESYTLDIESFKKAITKKTKAVIPVHLYGQPADMGPIKEIAEGKGIKIVEDCAQAHGAEIGGKKIGALGDFGCFSFYPTKNLGAYGDGGAILTDSGEDAESLRILRNVGQEGKYNHIMKGVNSRMDSMQGAVLRTKLKHLDSWNEKRRKNAKIYNELLQGVITPREFNGRKHVYHIYAIRSVNRDRLQEHLGKDGIQSLIHYPIPIHMQKAYSEMKFGRLPFTEKISGEILSLPMFPELSEDEIRQVAKSIRSFK